MLTKQNLPINFAQGLDTITDSFQVAAGKFLALENSVFDKAGQLRKRNGFGALTPLPNTDSAFITTLSGNLVALGNRLSSYAQGSQTWIDKGALQPVDVSVLSVIRGNVGQSQVDSVTHPNGLVCSVYTDDVPTGGGVLTPSYKYVITDSSTGGRVVGPAIIPSLNGALSQPAKVFLLNNLFVIVFTNVIGTASILQYVVINAFTPTLISSPATISTNYKPGPVGLAPYFEGAVNNGNLYLAWVGTTDIRMTVLDSNLNLFSPKIYTSSTATILSVTIDTSTSNPIVYLTSYDSVTGDATVRITDKNLVTIGSPVVLLPGLVLANIATAATGGVLTAFYEQANTYGYDTKIQTNIIRSVTMTQAGVVSIPTLIARSVGLASKAFILQGNLYVLATYVSNYQPTYFLLNAVGQVIAKLAYSNASGSYLTKGLPTAQVVDNQVKIGYLIKDTIEAVNKLQGAPNTGGVYSQTGINTATITVTSESVASAETGKDLHVTGGFMWMYDGSMPVEHGFHLWPDYVEAAGGTGGALKAQKYYYVATYEWTDAQGNVFRSAPSLPILVDTTDTTGQGTLFYGEFSIGDTDITVSSTDGLFVGMPITDISQPGAFPPATKITVVGVGSITVDHPAVLDSATTPGDNMATTTVASSVTYTAKSFTVIADDASKFKVGQVVTDITTPSNIPANTYITAIDTTTGELTLNNQTVGNSATDQMRGTGPVAQAYWAQNTTGMRVTNTDGFTVGATLTSSTLPGAFQADTRITAVDPINFTITVDKPFLLASSTLNVFNPDGIAATDPNSPNQTLFLAASGLVSPPSVGDLILFGPPPLEDPRVDVITSYTVDPFFGDFAIASRGLPNGNQRAQGYLYWTSPQTINQGVTVFSANYKAGATVINVNSIDGLGVGMVVTDDTSPSNIDTNSRIVSINAPAKTITIDKPTLAGTNPSVIQTTSVFSATVNVPTLRLTYKVSNPVRVAIYRWSESQQTYYQVTPVRDPILNNTTSDFITFTDNAADSAIVGNNILYTTGGVVENIAAPPISALTLYKSRLFAVDAEDRNLLWYSKQVIENTPVEMSDLFTIYVSPTAAAQGDTGPITALGALDDKLIIFKKNALYYITGNGPDNTGINNDFSEPVFITSAVGCTNPRSIVFTANGLMFQSEKGIWLLGRDLSTSYIGAPVDGIAVTNRVLSSINVPNSNEVRFMLDNNVTLIYDYYFQQWGTFTNVPAISSTTYQSLHTYINSRGEVRQETPGKYLDAGHPVLLSFTTSWLNLAGLQGFERAYFFYLLGVFISPHKLNVQIAYDYNSSPTQVSVITPDNYTPAWGGEQLWGSGASWGGSGNVEQHRVFLSQQKCQAFQITITEVYDPSAGVVAGAGFTLSGLNMVVGMKSNYPRLKASKSVG